MGIPQKIPTPAKTMREHDFDGWVLLAPFIFALTTIPLIGCVIIMQEHDAYIYIYILIFFFFCRYVMQYFCFMFIYICWFNGSLHKCIINPC